MEAQSAPRLRKLKWTEFYNNNGSNPDDLFVVCLPRYPFGDIADHDSAKERDAIAAVTTAFNTITPIGLVVSHCYAGYTLELPWKHRAYAYAVMTAALHAGLDIFTQNRMPINVRHTDLPADQALTPELMERIHVIYISGAITRAMVERNMDLTRQKNFEYVVIEICGSNMPIFCRTAPWITDEGRALVATIQKITNGSLTRMTVDEEVPEDSLVEYVVASSSSSTTRATAIVIPDEEDNAEATPAKKRRIDNDPDDSYRDALCVVCMDARANTLVLPCMHVCVCSTCSPKLKGTTVEKRCLHCNQAITSVIADYQ